MRLFSFFVLVLATLLLGTVAVVLFRVLFPPPTVMVGTESDAPARWWPWSITSYNHWPYWMGDSGGSGSGSGGSGSGDNHKGYEPRPPGLEGGHSRPWGGAQRGANGGAGHHVSSAPPAPAPAPPAPAPLSPSSHPK